MAEITIKHYRSAHAGARHKELIVEKVTEGSETSQFLKKMDAQRIRRVCFENIDMRGKVPGDCQRYVLNNRTFYLDDTSYGIYQQGLKAYNGAFTIGTYEAIVNGGHTNRAIREAQTARELEAQQKSQPDKRNAAAKSSGGARENDRAAAETVADLYQPDLIPLGYFKRRSEDRLQYVTAVQIQAGGQPSNGTTRDISVSGLQITLKGLYRFTPGTELAVALPSLQEQDSKLDMLHLRYCVIASEQNDAEHQLRVQLIPESAPAGFEKFIGDLIERYKRKYKLDVEDDYWSVYSWLYERIYSESAMQLSFFVSQDQERELRTQAVAVTDGNQPFAHFFRNDADNFDFSALCLPDRLRQLLEHGEFLLLLYREKIGNEYRLHSVADFELKDELELQTMLRFTLAHDEHCIAKVVASNRPLQPISTNKFDMLTGRLFDKAAEEVISLRERIAELVFTGAVIDITSQIKSAFSSVVALERGQIDVQGLHCWVGGSRRQLPLYTEVERLTIMPAPELIRFGYVERRCEDRYLAETSVEVITRAGRSKGRTRDISKRGLAIRVEQALEVAAGDDIKVALISLQAKRPSLDLSKVPYRVIKVDRNDGITTIMLERLRDKYEHEIDDFFVELITKNRQKLAVDVNDTRGATLSRVYEGTAAENAGTLPFFIARQEQGGGRLQAVAVPEGNCALAAFFRDADQQYDFAWLSESRLVLALYQQMGQMAREAAHLNVRPSPIEIEVYAFKVLDTQGRSVLRIVTEFEFVDETQREAFITQALATDDFRILKLAATYTLELNKTDLDATIETIRNQSRHRAGKLQEQLNAVVGHGEIIDITAQYLLGRKLARL
jgi:c-di-GMP-binding flagellar brake protein YcgR